MQQALRAGRVSSARGKLANAAAVAGTHAARRAAASAGRRASIFKALHDCVIEKGYAATSLADVARTAGMSPSHLLYYFAGKEAILARYFALMTRRITERLDTFRTEDPRRQIDLVATLFFASKGISKSEIGFMLECFGVAVHDKEIQREKTELDRFCKAYLRELFERFPRRLADPVNTAEVAYALLVGLRTATYFDERLAPEHALELFRTHMLYLAESAPRARNARRAAPAAVRARRRNGKAAPD